MIKSTILKIEVAKQITNLCCFNIYFGIEIKLTGDGGGIVTSNLIEDGEEEYNNSIDGIESLVLAHACAGVDVKSPAYIEGIETAVESCANNI